MLISLIKKQLLTNWIANHLVGVITFDFFYLMDISVVNSRAIYKVLYPNRMESLHLKIVLAKSLIGTYNSAVEMHWSVMCLRVEYFQLVSHYTSQFFEEREENVDTAILKGLKTKT